MHQTPACVISKKDAMVSYVRVSTALQEKPHVTDGREVITVVPNIVCHDIDQHRDEASIVSTPVSVLWSCSGGWWIIEMAVHLPSDERQYAG